MSESNEQKATIAGELALLGINILFFLSGMVIFVAGVSVDTPKSECPLVPVLGVILFFVSLVMFGVNAQFYGSTVYRVCTRRK